MGFQTSDMAREWAKGERASRRRSGIRTWYEGASFYSYQTEIARRLENGMTWVTSQTYSVSTSRHTHDALSYAHGRIVRCESCPDEETIQEMIGDRTSYLDLMEHCDPGNDDVRAPPRHWPALAELRAGLPEAFDPLIAQRIFDRIADRYKVHVAPIVLSDRPEYTGTELQHPSGRPPRQTWFNLLHAFVHSLDGNDTRHGKLFDRRMAKIAGLIVKDYAKLGPCERADSPAPSNVERSPLAGADSPTVVEVGS